MNRRTSGFTLLAVSAVCILILAACNCAPVLTYIVITPASQTLAVGATQQYTATGYYSNGSITPNINVSWGASPSTVATISTSGLVTATGIGTATITATLSGISASPATLTVNQQLLSIAITPLNQTISVGTTLQYDAMGTFAGTGGGSPTTSDITSQVNWTTGNTSIATFSSTTPGQATGVAAGTTTVQASLDGINSNTTNLTINGTILVITPSKANGTIAVGNAMSFTVVEQQSGGSTNPTTYPVTWTSSSPAVGGVVANGNSAALGSALTVGTTTITATESAPVPVTGTLVVTVVAGTTSFAYVSNSNTYALGSYTVTAGTAPYLTPLATLDTAGYSPTQTVLNPNGQYLYDVETTGNTIISTYAISSAGALTVQSGTVTVDPTAAQSTTYGITDPYGRFLYVCDITDSSNANGAIYVYTISQTNGALTQVGSPYTTNVNGPTGLLIDHTGSYLYATNNNDATNGVSAYSINQTTGALTPLTPATYPVGNPTTSAPAFPAWDPTGTYMYIADGDTTITTYTLGTGGALTNENTSTTAAGAFSINSVAVTPNGSYLYAVDSGNGSTNGGLYGFTLTSGVPSTAPISGSPFALGIDPTNIIIDPTGALIAINNVGDGATPALSNISLFTIGSGGAVTSQTAATTGLSPYFVTFYNVP
jgi:trimeric autotransporter adhesin